MNREYLESFNDEQLEHYLKTLKRRVSDLRQLTIQLTKENQQLGAQYEALTKEKFEVYSSIEKKKKGWGSWLNKGKEKLTNILHIGKKQQKKTEAKEVVQQQPKLQEEPAIQIYQESREPQAFKIKESPSKKVTMQNFNFDDLYYLGREKITNLFRKNKEGYHPNDRDNSQLHNGKRQEALRENVELIRQITGDQPEFKNNVQIQHNAEESELRRKLLVEAEIAKKTSITLQNAIQQKQAVESNPCIQKQAPKQKQEQVKLDQQQHVKEQKQKHQADNLQAGQEDQQFGVHFEAQMNEYQLREQNVSQIIEKQAEKALQSQQDIEENTTQSTDHQQPKEQESK